MNQLALIAGGASSAALPITPWLPAIAEAVQRAAVTLICGATGSGKSTRVPRLCLETWPRLRVGLTQPRRLAARTIAARIAQEAGCPLGGTVGFQTRFERQVSADSRLKVMTDGILLQEIARDPMLSRYDVLIIDEVHERTVNIDFLLGYLRQLLPRRPGFKVVLMSATLEAGRFQRFFDAAACVEIPGATFPVEVRYRPLEAEPEGGAGLHEAIVAALAELDEEARGDVLVFLPGEREISEAAEVLRAAGLAETVILPLYARLSVADQQRVFQPHRERHVVLATNVAETSVTVPGVRHVIDSGLARLASYSARSKLQRLPIAQISQASAEQRQGRCGRERAGICIRLYSEAKLLRSPRYTEPELLRSNLAGVMLRLADLGLGRLEDFPLLDPPRHNAISDGYQLLRELGAMDADRRLLRPGRQLARLPLDPRLARMVLAGREAGCLAEIIVIVSAISAGDPRERPVEARQAADLAHAGFSDHRSDFLWFLNAWRALVAEMLPLSRRQQQAWCRARYWSWRRVREWIGIESELSARLQVKPSVPAPSYRELHQALLCGLLTRIARWVQKTEYVGCRQQRLRLHPSSALRAKPPHWIIAAEIVETGHPYARLAAKIDPKWVVERGGSLIRRSHSLPQWDATRGEAQVLEEQSLHGLVLHPGRRIPLQSIDPRAAHEVFLREGLLHGGLGAKPAFLARNLALVARVEAAQARARRRDLLAEEHELLDFYRARIPPHIATRRALLAWLRAEPSRDPLLTMADTVATRAGIEHINSYLFPETLILDGKSLPLAYRYAPGEEDDGITLEIPVAVLAQISPPSLDRLVPGLLTEKIACLVRRLPKEYRKYLAPLSEFAPALTAAIEPVAGRLEEALTLAIERITGLSIPLVAWNLRDLPPHLAIRVRLLDASGAALAITRDLPGWITGHGTELVESFAALRWPLPSGSATTWIFGTLPEQLTETLCGVEVHGYPALAPTAGPGVAARAFANREQAAASHRVAVLRLLEHALPAECRRLRKECAAQTRLELLALKAGLGRGLAEELYQASLETALGQAPLPRGAEEFLARSRQAGSRLSLSARERIIETEALLDRLSALADELGPGVEASWPDVARDLRQQWQQMFQPGFLSRDRALLAHYPRYLEAQRVRLARLPMNPARDARQQALFEDVLRAGQARRGALSPPAAARLDFLLAELRVALFAPTLKTAEKISPQRVEAFLASACLKN